MKYTKQIFFRATPEQKAMLEKLTSESNLTSPGDYIRRVLFNGIHDESPIEPDKYNSKPKKLNISLPGFIADGIRARAENSGVGVGRYISSLLQSKLTETPVFTKPELSALENASDQLFKIGRNINQLSHHFNATKKAGKLPNFDPVKYEVFLSLNVEIKKAMESIRELVRASRGVF